MLKVSAPADGTSEQPTSGRRSDRAAAGVFGAACALAVPVYLYLGRSHWFRQDEFMVLARPVGSVGDLFRAHNEHLIVPARILYAAGWELFGLHHYWPYQLWVVLAHVALAALLRVAMRRAGVSGWVATAAALVFLTFGRGSANILWGFQITFTGAVAAGYAHLLLADHDGPVGRRDALGIAAGVVAASSSATGLVMVGVVGLAMLLRRGWRVAALHTVPIATLVVAWTTTVVQRRASPPVGEILLFTERGARTTFLRITPNAAVAGLMVVAVAVGLFLMARHEGAIDAVRRVAVPLSLAVGGIAMLLLTGYGRVGIFGVRFADAPRYSHLFLALVLPLVAVGLQGLVTRRAWMALPVVVLLLAEVPANVFATEQANRDDRAAVLAAVQHPALDDMSPDVVPFPDRLGFQWVTVAWLLEGRRADKFPDVGVSPEWRAEVDDRFAIDVRGRPVDRSSCRPFPEGTTVTLDAGETLALVGSVVVWPASPGLHLEARGYAREDPYELVATVDTLTLTVYPFREGSASLC